jgi:hypothetical protein
MPTWADAINCEAEGGVTFVEYGDNVACSFDFDNDVDVYEFVGNAGDQPFISVTPDTCCATVRLFSQGALLEENTQSANSEAIIQNFVLPSDGVYTVQAVQRVNQTTPNNYILQLPCIDAACTVPPPPSGLLSFETVVPCRIVDTRRSVGGDLQAGDPQSFIAYGTAAELAPQGGSFDAEAGTNFDCPNPQAGLGLTPVAIAANVTAVGNQASGAGNIVAYATGADEPSSSLVNFTPGTNIANSTVIELCEADSCAADFDLKANFANVPATVDVLGYYYRTP